MTHDIRRWSSGVLISTAAVWAMSCSNTPAEPSDVFASVSAVQSSVKAAAPTPSPAPAKCSCTSVSVTFDPGGQTPTWGVYSVKKNSTWRVGFRIDVTCTGTGQSNLCKVSQIENGTLSWTLGDKPGQIVGGEKKVTNFHKGSFGDPWQKEYSDALGADYPGNTTDLMSITLSMEFEIKCVSSDDQVVSKKFKVEGTVEAQAATRGAKPTLAKPVITYTPQG